MLPRYDLHTACSYHMVSYGKFVERRIKNRIRKEHVTSELKFVFSFKVLDLISVILVIIRFRFGNHSTLANFSNL